MKLTPAETVALGCLIAKAAQPQPAVKKPAAKKPAAKKPAAKPSKKPTKK